MRQAAQVDWLNVTFPAPKISSAGFVTLLSRMLERPISAVECGGLLGFEKSVKLFAHHGSDESPFGAIAFGGESQNGRWLFQITGGGCQFVRDWQGLVDLLEDLGAKITRLDLALDFLEGEHTVDHALMWYEMGGFDFDGRMRPKSRIDGDWMDGVDGRTLYVGKAKNGKMLRVYEKGRQLGDPLSEWVRFEVQLGSRDREIPFEALTRRDAFFAGCYPVLAQLVDEAAESIATSREKGKVSLGHLFFHLKRCYGKVVDALVGRTGAMDAELVEEVRVIGLPRRLDPGSAAGVTWADVLAQSKRKFK